MRKVVVPVSIVALAVGAWLSIKEPSHHTPAAVPADIAPVATLPENNSIAATEDTQVVAAPGAPAAMRDPPLESVPAMRWPYQDAEFWTRLVTYLVSSGLAEVDSRRIANQAVEGLVECAVRHGWDTEERRSASPRCDEDVLQQAGLNETIRLTALDETLANLSRRNEAGRTLARNRALEALAEVRARQSNR